MSFYYGYAVYVDTGQSKTRPTYVLFGEACVVSDKQKDPFDLLKGYYGPGLPMEQMRIFAWRSGCKKLESRRMSISLEEEEEGGVVLHNIHFDLEPSIVKVEFDQIRLFFEDGVKEHTLNYKFEKAMLRDDREMGEMDKYHMGIHQSHLGSLTIRIPREYFYLKGEACFTMEWVESRFELFKQIFPNETPIVVLIYTLTSFVNYWVTYTSDEFTINDKRYNFELFSNRTTMVQSGDCEDVAAWLMSAFSRVKHFGWCKGKPMEKFMAINLLLKVDNGCVEGRHDDVSHGVIKSREETLDIRNQGGFHVTCMIIEKEHLDSIIFCNKIYKGDVYVAEGTALVYPVFTRLVEGLEDSRLLRDLKRTTHCDISNFIGVHDSVNDGLPIYHTLVEIMINLEYCEEDYTSSIFVACTKDTDGEEKYPVTLQGFCNGEEKDGRRVYLKPLMTITREDHEKYNEIMELEPPLLELDDEIGKPDKIPSGVHIGNLGFTLQGQVKQNEDDLIISMGCLDLVIPSSVGS